MLLCCAAKRVQMEDPQWAGQRKQKASFNHTLLPVRQQALNKSYTREHRHTHRERDPKLKIKQAQHSQGTRETGATNTGDLTS